MRLLVTLLFLIVSAAFAVFAVANRSDVIIDLFPLPYTLEMPKFFLVLIGVTLGAVVAGLTLLTSYLRHAHKLLKAERRISALENEIGGMKAERTVIPALRGDLEPRGKSVHVALDPRMKRG